jgi:cell wall-associated NlpC family hydrolase
MIVYLNILVAKVYWRRLCFIASLLILLLFMSGCMQKVKVTYAPRQVKPVLNGDVGAKTSGSSNIDAISCEYVSTAPDVQGLQRYFKSWRGVRYRYGGVTTKGVDCSGLILRAYKDLYDVDLPRTVAEQARKGTRIQKKYLRPGDLIFFKTGRYSRHVGMYLGQNKFIHASRSKGVIQSNLNNAYWRTKYWQAKRF